jgi:hypothetical protein
MAGEFLDDLPRSTQFINKASRDPIIPIPLPILYSPDRSILDALFINLGIPGPANAVPTLTILSLYTVLYDWMELAL